MDWALPAPIWNTWQARSSIRRPVPASGPVVVWSGPVCVPFHVISSRTVSPLTTALWNVAFESGSALAGTGMVQVTKILTRFVGERQ